MIEQLALRYGHCDGITSISASAQLRRIITAGDDGQIRLWQDFVDDVPQTFDVADQIFAIALQENTILIANEENVVQVRSLDDGSLLSNLAQFSLPVTHMVTSNDGHLLVASSDTSVKWLNTADATFTCLNDHQGPVFSVAVDCRAEYASTACGDGYLRIWDLSRSVCIERMKVLPEVKEFCQTISWHRMDWHPDGGRQLAVPIGNMLQLYDRHSWLPGKTFQTDSDNDVANICVFNEDGSLLAMSCLSGTVFVWAVVSRKLIFRQPHPKTANICAMIWNPFRRTQLLFADVSSNVGGFDNFPESEDLEEQLTDDISLPRRVVDLEDENSMDFDISKIKTQFTSQQVAAPSSQRSAVTAEEILEKLDRRFKMRLPNVLTVGSTPMTSDQHYMKWNRTAMVKRFAGPEVGYSIDVEFHDTVRHQSMHFENASTDFSLADVSDEAVTFASYSTPTSRSQVYVSYFGCWSSMKEWYVDLPEEENVQAICLGENWVAFVSDQQVLRTYTLSGLLVWVCSISGPVIAMTGRANKLFVVYHDSTDATGHHKFGVFQYIFDASSSWFPRVSSQTLALSPGASLHWICVTELGTLCSADTKGLIRILVNDQWVPVCNLKTAHKKGPTNLWPVDVLESAAKVLCVCCKQANCPDITPTPPMVQVDWQLFACRPAHSDAIVSDALLLSHFQNRLIGDTNPEHSCSAQNYKQILKSFATACTADMCSLALDVASMCADERNLELLVRYAHKNRQPVLMRKLEVLLESRRNNYCANVEQLAAECNASLFAINSSDQVVDQSTTSDSQRHTYVFSSDAPTASSDVTIESSTLNDTTLTTPEVLAVKRCNPFKRKNTTPSGRRSSNTDSIFDAGSPDKKEALSSWDTSTPKRVARKEAKLTSLFKSDKQNSQATQLETDDASQELFPDLTQMREKICDASKESFTAWFSENRDTVISEYKGDGNDHAGLLRFAMTHYRKC